MSTGISLDQLDDKQRLAVERCIDTSKRCAAVTGPAGSGKTTIMRFAHEALTEAGYDVEVAAPTGKAARRIREATGLPAQTIHKLLEYGSPREFDARGRAIDPTRPRRDRENPLECAAVIADEYAMVNRELHAALVAALPPGGRLITFGDIRQLPPIETSAAIAREPTAFKMLLDKFDGVVLDRVHRQAEDSGVLAAAQNVLKGMPPKSNNKDFTMEVTDRPVDAVFDELDRNDYKRLDNQIITPVNISWIGTYKLNHQVQPMLMDAKRETISLDRHKWHAKQPVRVGVGDKVVMCKNWYDLECSDGTRGVFNGEVGIITAIDFDTNVISIDMEDRIVYVPPICQITIGNSVVVGLPHKDLQLAYVLTTHKCQGSEFKNVTYVINKSAFQMLNRRNMYTALTRARDSARLITDIRALSVSLAMTEPRVFGDN